MDDSAKIVKTNDEWKKKLSPEAYHVAREKGTEPAFTGKYYAEHAKGMYKCVACGNELFSSETKFDSGTGWPSFTQPMQSKAYYVYALKMNNGQLYVGSTNNLIARIKAHKNGLVFTTKKYLPVVLIYYETYSSENEARSREKSLKYHGSAFAKLKASIRNNQEISLAGFTDPVNLRNVELHSDDSYGMRRTEVACAKCGAHLGHVFDDGPKKMPDGTPASGKRFCINSVCLELEKEN